MDKDFLREAEKALRKGGEGGGVLKACAHAEERGVVETRAEDTDFGAVAEASHGLSVSRTEEALAELERRRVGKDAPERELRRLEGYVGRGQKTYFDGRRTKKLTVRSEILEESDRAVSRAKASVCGEEAWRSADGASRVGEQAAEVSVRSLAQETVNHVKGRERGADHADMGVLDADGEHGYALDADTGGFAEGAATAVVSLGGGEAFLSRVGRSMVTEGSAAVRSGSSGRGSAGDPGSKKRILVDGAGDTDVRLTEGSAYERRSGGTLSDEELDALVGRIVSKLRIAAYCRR